MARVSPCLSSTVVCELRLFRPGTGEPPGTRVVATEKSTVLTSGSTVRRITSLSRMIGRKARRTPNSLNWVLDDPPPPRRPGPTPEKDGTGNSPPARKLAWWPLRAIRFGSARIFSRLLRRSAFRTVLNAPWPNVPNAVACDPSPSADPLGGW